MSGGYSAHNVVRTRRTTKATVSANQLKRQLKEKKNGKRLRANRPGGITVSKLGAERRNNCCPAAYILPRCARTTELWVEQIKREKKIKMF